MSIDKVAFWKKNKANVEEWIRRLRHWETHLKDATGVFMYAIPDPDNPGEHLPMTVAAETRCVRACLRAVRSEIKELHDHIRICDKAIASAEN